MFVESFLVGLFAGPLTACLLALLISPIIGDAGYWFGFLGTLAAGVAFAFGSGPVPGQSVDIRGVGVGVVAGCVGMAVLASRRK
jgi:hypothetical protein